MRFLQPYHQESPRNKNLKEQIRDNADGLSHLRLLSLPGQTHRTLDHPSLIELMIQRSRRHLFSFLIHLFHSDLVQPCMYMNLL